MSRQIITGGAGFIGHHLARHLAKQNECVLVIDKNGRALKEYSTTSWGRQIQWCQLDLASEGFVLLELIKPGDWIWALAADMGGMGYIGTGQNDLALSTENVMINANTIRAAADKGVDRVFYASSACVYNETLQMEEEITPLAEADAYPAQPDTIYGWEKLYSEQMYSALGRALLPTRIVRFHNVFGPEGTWRGGREKAPAALCRKVAEAKRNKTHTIEIWGDGDQRRSFLYISDALVGMQSVMESSLSEAVNVGQDSDISINELAMMIAVIADWEIELVHVDGPQGVRGRNADISLAYEALGWYPMTNLANGIAQTYDWIEFQVNNK